MKVQVLIVQIHNGGSADFSMEKLDFDFKKKYLDSGGANVFLFGGRVEIQQQNCYFTVFFSLNTRKV